MKNTLKNFTLAALLLMSVSAAAFDDTDHDGVENERDNCVTAANADQVDTDLDDRGDACDEDIDNDGVPNPQDPAPLDSSL